MGCSKKGMWGWEEDAYSSEGDICRNQNVTPYFTISTNMIRVISWKTLKLALQRQLLIAESKNAVLVCLPLIYTFLC